MSSIGESILKMIVGPPARRSPQDEAAKPESFADYIEWHYQSMPKLMGKMPGLDLVGKRVLEIRCGTGGRTAYLDTPGPEELVAIDIKGSEIEIAKHLVPKMFGESAAKIQFIHCEENSQLKSA